MYIGDIDKPYEWDPEVLPIQILRLGNVFILSVPAELTTMAGRRLRNAVRSILESGNNILGNKPRDKIHVTIAGLANNYARYCFIISYSLSLYINVVNVIII